MTKYDFNFKLKVVKSYFNREGGYVSAAKQYEVINHSQVERWVNTYNVLGEDRLKIKNKNTFYIIQFKLDIINYMTTTESSTQEVTNHFRMNNSTLITTWKQKFLHDGVDALSKMKGRPSINKTKLLKEKNKLTYMYCQNLFDIENTDKNIK
ncbi:transposase [Clostridioides difficile]|uniref:helix-turn-helix domain-containing protein n=1 Tax=Clostridioides difficile TaxID=1496 RepID=UPI0010B57299|nr:transposase [Clostridioides difficile]UUC43105.1 transposase [Clostridioides difficile]VIF69057.1 transposase IS3/IS911 family protein [Clostridioides difficile]